MFRWKSDADISPARLDKYEWILRCSKLSSSFKIGKKLLSISKDASEMNPLDEIVSTLRIAEFVRSMLPNRRLIFSDNIFLMHIFPVRVFMDTLALYAVCSLSDIVPGYFKRNELVDENARYILWFASFFDSSRDFILTVFKHYQSLTAFSWKDIGNDQRRAVEEFDKDEEV